MGTAAGIGRGSGSDRGTGLWRANDSLLPAFVPVQKRERDANLLGLRTSGADQDPPNRIPAAVEQPGRLGQVGVKELVLDRLWGFDRRDECPLVIAIRDFRHPISFRYHAAACHARIIAK